MLRQHDISEAAEVLLFCYPTRAMREAKRREYACRARGDTASAENWSIVANLIAFAQTQEAGLFQTRH